MTQEEKQLLLVDLCARLTYGVMLNIDYYDLQGDGKLKNRDVILSYGNIGYCSGNTNWVSVKPYLRPMSSMTEEEKKELKTATCPEGTGYFNEHYLICPMSHFCEHISYDFMSDILNWLNAHHFDYRNLIEKGLAIEVTEENNPYKE